MKLRVLIAEDEPLARERLRELLMAEKMIEIVAECVSGQETINAIKQTQPDVVFLDVKMPDLDGFDVIKGLNRAHPPVIIFVTAYDRFALRAFDVHAADFLLKPFDRARFQTALGRARERLHHGGGHRKHHQLSEALADSESHSTPPERLTIKSQGRIAFVNTADIDWVAAADNYVELHVGETTHLLRNSIRSLANQLPKHQFVRISRSHLVNLDRINEIRSKTHGDYLIVLRNGTRLTASRTYRQNLSPLLGDSRRSQATNSRLS